MKSSIQLKRSSLTVDADKGVVTSDQWVPHDQERVFKFFSDAYNLERLTPPFLNFKVLSMNTPKMEEGAEIHYKLKVHGVPVRWTSRITDWNEPSSFSDIQISGPYRYWCHRHLFEPEDGGTWMRDRVDYKPPLGFVGRMIIGRFVANDVERIFQYRQQVIDSIFKSPASTA